MPVRSRSAPTVTGDAREALNLVRWLRADGAEVLAVTVGNVTVTLSPARPQHAPRAGDQADESTIDRRGALYEQFGGEMYRRAVNGAPRGASVPGADFQPAIATEPGA